jgi:hypothetical protein
VRNHLNGEPFRPVLLLINSLEARSRATNGGQSAGSGDSLRSQRIDCQSRTKEIIAGRVPRDEAASKLVGLVTIGATSGKAKSLKDRRIS